jgi:hypothetical protein
VKSVDTGLMEDLHMSRNYLVSERKVWKIAEQSSSYLTVHDHFVVVVQQSAEKVGASTLPREHNERSGRAAGSRRRVGGDHSHRGLAHLVLLEAEFVIQGRAPQDINRNQRSCVDDAPLFLPRRGEGPYHEHRSQAAHETKQEEIKDEQDNWHWRNQEAESCEYTFLQIG